MEQRDSLNEAAERQAPEALKGSAANNGQGGSLKCKHDRGPLRADDGSQAFIMAPYIPFSYHDAIPSQSEGRRVS